MVPDTHHSGTPFRKAHCPPELCSAVKDAVSQPGIPLLAVIAATTACLGAALTRDGAGRRVGQLGSTSCTSCMCSTTTRTVGLSWLNQRAVSTSAISRQRDHFRHKSFGQCHEPIHIPCIQPTVARPEVVLLAHGDESSSRFHNREERRVLAVGSGTKTRSAAVLSWRAASRPGLARLGPVARRLGG